MDYAAIGKLVAESDSVVRPVAAGRILQYDADFGCYECAHLDDTVEQNFRQLKKHVEVKRALAGADRVNVHVTLGLKGGRNEIATVKPYQEQRVGKNADIKERVRLLRNLLANHKTNTVTPVANMYTEADDSLSIYQLEDIENSVLMSGDKDLHMVAGMHCDQKTGRMYKVEGFGETSTKEVGNVKPKLCGTGTSWFWHQLLMGDTADNIPGLPKLSGPLCNRYIPLKKHNPKRKAIACGPAKAEAILKGVTNDKNAMDRVLEAYQGFYPDNAREMLVEQAFLLWMRRTNKINDCVLFLNEVGLKCTFSAKQMKALQKYKELCLIQKEQGEINNE